MRAQFRSFTGNLLRHFAEDNCMKTRTIVATLVSFAAGLAIAYAADVNVGTWKLNESKSKFPAGATKNQTVVYTEQGDSMKVVVDGTDKDGKAVHNEWVGKFDGKDYPVTGQAGYDSRAYTKAADGSLDMTIKAKGKVVATGNIKVTADGKSRTVDTKGTTDASMTATAVYDKQ
jgi:hypothetical protein